MEYNISPLSNDTDNSGESCIICLDSVDDKTVWFPSIYSSCTCKYPIHLECIKENNIDKCIICSSNIEYPVSVQQININIFENENENENENCNTNIYDLEINTNIVTEDSIQEEYNCRIFAKKLCAVIIICLSSAFSIFIWYIVTT
jgi:hypothetical protein